MKKVLFATTALVLSAGVAAAEVSVGGTGRMGVVYNGNDWNFSSRIRVKFTMSGQTDGGLEFGASVRADQASAANSNGTAGSVYISGSFGKVEMGDVVGAPEALFGDFYEVGYTDLSTSGIGMSNDIPYLTGDNGGNVTTATQNSGPNLLYTGTFSGVSVAASMSDGKAGSTKVSQEYAVAAAYTFGNYTVGAGYEMINGAGAIKDQTQGELAGVATFGNTSVKAAFAKGGKNNPVDKWYGLGVSSVFGATTVGGYIQKAEYTAGGNATWYGIGAEYDLGGGATIKGGIADDNTKVGGKSTDPVADLGIKFSF